MADDITTERLTLHTIDDLALQAEARVPREATAVVVLAHPHPAHGGSMHSLVTSELFRVLPSAGLACVRFNFRGVGSSEGEHGGGPPERNDIGAAVAYAHDRFPTLTLVLCGWSFGADVSASITDKAIAGWALIAPPLRTLDLDALAVGADARPKLLLIPENDPFRDPAGVAELTSGWVNSTLEVIAGADHFLAGRTDAAATLVAHFADGLAIAR
jgi:alpha/beta superfamily hydrolase